MDGLGETWQIAEATVKAYPVCAILQGPVDSMLKIVRTRGLDPDTVTEAVLELSPYEATYPGIDNPGPFTSNTATKMSAQFSLGLALTDRALTLDGLFRLDDAAICAQAKRVRIVADPTLAPRSSRLRLRLVDSGTLMEEVSSPVGQPSFDEIAAFSQTLVPELDVGRAAVDSLIREIAVLEQAPHLNRLFDKALFTAA